jgi:hypothetical protein
MAEAGRPTDLTEELFSKIKQSIIDGNDLRETAKICEIVESTLYTWHSKNYLNIADKIEGWKRDRKIMLAGKNVDEMLVMDSEDAGKLKVKADITKFVLSTLDKNYKPKTDITSDGKPIYLPSELITKNEPPRSPENDSEG